MANYSAIKAAVNGYIKQNGRKEITGKVLNAVLNAVIDSLGRYFQFAGGAMPTDDPGTPDQNVCYLATEPGLYVHFNNIRIGNEEVALLFWNGEWVKQTIAIGIQEVEASVDNNSGTPSVDVSYSQGQLVLTFHNLKGEQGIQGVQGIQGIQGIQGEPGVTEVIATIDATSGVPSCNATLVNGVLTLAFSGLKGIQGDPGSSIDYPFTLVNNLTTDDTTKALSAAMGKFIQDEIDGGSLDVSEELDLSVYTRIPANINSSDKWVYPSETAESVFVPITGKKKVTVTISGATGVIALLTNNTPVNGQTPSFATGETGRRQISDGSSLEVTIPYDANYLFVVTKSSYGDISNNYTIFLTHTQAVGGLVHRNEIVDNLTSDNGGAPLSARQGKVLKELVDSKRDGVLEGKKISIIGDSISCFGTENQTRNDGYNAPYWIVKSVDVGHTIQSWVTWLDVYTSVNSTTRTNKTIGGVTLTPEMIGTKQSFIPVSADVGKAIGVPRWASSYTTKPWWQVLIDETGAELCNNASWSGSRIIPIPEGNDRHDAFVLSEAYSEYTLKRVCNRDDAGNVIVPDVIIIYRGTNDFSAEDPEGGSVTDDDESITTPDMMTFNGITDAHNFTQGYIWTILKLRELYPNAYIVLCTLNIFKRVNYSRFPVNNGTYTLPDYNNKIREIANLMGCGLIEFDKDGITFENCYPTYISDDASKPTHPNTNGHRVMGERAIADLTFVLNPTS